MDDDQNLEDFASNLVRILNFGNLPVEKQREISQLIQDPKYSNITSVKMSSCKLFSTSFFSKTP